MQILILGTGCAKCKTLAQFTEQAVKELGITAEINKVTDLKQIMALGVMMTPALAVNGTIKVAGKVPTIPEIKAILQQAAV
jgi:small redox-active disulfide protein 2